MSRRSQQTKKQQKKSPQTSSSKDEGEMSKSLGTSAEESGMRSLGAESVTMESPPESGSSQFPRKDLSESNTTTEEQSESVAMESPAKGGSSQFPRKDSSESKTTTEEQSESLGAGYKRLGTTRSPIKKSIQKVKGLATSAVRSLHGFASSRRGKTPPAKDKSGQGHSKKAYVLLPEPADLDRHTLKSALSQFYDHFHAPDAAGTAHYSKRTSSEQDPERPEESVEVVVLGCAAGKEDAEEEAAPEGVAQEATAEEEDDVLVRRYSNLSASTGSGSSRKTGSTKSAHRFNFQARSSPESWERRHSPPSAGPSSRGASSHSVSDFGRGKSRARPNLRRATEKSHPRPVKAADRKFYSSTDSSKSLQIFELCEVKDGSLAKRRLSRERDSILEEQPAFLEPSCRESPDGVKRPAVGGHGLRPPPLPSRYVDDSEVAGTSRCSDPLFTLAETYDSIQSLSAPTAGSQPGETRSEAWSDTYSSTASRSTITRLMKRFYLYVLKKFTRAEPTVNDFFDNLANCIQNQVRSSCFIPPAARYLCLIGLNFFLVVRFPFTDYWFYCGASEKSGVNASGNRGSGSATGVTETTNVMDLLDCRMSLLSKPEKLFPRIDELGPHKVKLIWSFDDEKAGMSATDQADANRSNLNAPDPSDANEKSGEDIHTDEEPEQTD